MPTRIANIVNRIAVIFASMGRALISFIMLVYCRWCYTTIRNETSMSTLSKRSSVCSILNVDVAELASGGWVGSFRATQVRWMFKSSQLPNIVPERPESCHLHELMPMQCFGLWEKSLTVL